MPTILANKIVKDSTTHSIPTNFMSGGFALATSFAIMHPLDTLKTQIQTNQRNLRGLFRGFAASFLLAFPQGGLRLSSYETCKSKISQKTNNVALASALSACVGDTISSIVKVPREIVTARLQSGMDLKLMHKGGSPTLITFKEVVRTQGPMGLFRGFWSTTARDWPFMVILFSSYESLKSNHHRFVPGRTKESKIDALYSTIFGGFSGALAGFWTTPFDVVKTGIMTNRAKSVRISSVVKNLYTTNGPRAFFTGAAARSVWW